MSAPAEPLTVVPAISLHLRDRVRLHSSAPVLGRKNTSRRSRQPETYEAIVKVVALVRRSGMVA